jgi:peptidoglycan/xylan/chitin deacetylase (PgdA/CDA1 family)
MNATPQQVPMRKKEILARLGARSGALRLRRALPGAGRQLLILAYHRVLPDVDEATWPFDVELLSATPADFDWQMAFVARQLRPVTLSQVVASVQGGAALPRRAVLVSFDDGFADNHDHALPVLRRHGVPACVFLATDLIGTSAQLWFETVAHLLMRAPAGSRCTLGDGSDATVPAPPTQRRLLIARALQSLKRLDETGRGAWVQGLQGQFGPHTDPAVAPLTRMLSWDEARAMQRGGVEFGSHGATHAVLSQLTPEALAAELQRSRAVLERELGCETRALAYPVGGPQAFNEAVIAAAKQAGFRLGLSYIQGRNPLQGFDPFRLRRQHVERFTSRAYFEAMLSWPTLFY